MIRREGSFILWPSYFDKNISKSRGRRVPKALAVPNPSAKEIAEASRRLGFEARIEEGAYPRRWWLREGKVVVAARGISKKEIIKMIAKELINMRSSKHQHQNKIT